MTFGGIEIESRSTCSNYGVIFVAWNMVERFRGLFRTNKIRIILFPRSRKFEAIEPCEKSREMLKYRGEDYNGFRNLRYISFYTPG